MHATLARLNRLVADLAPESDGRLLDAFLAGDEPAFRELVRRHGSLVFAVCQRVLRHRQDAEDAFQAVFLVLARRASDVWPRDAVGSWLYGVAYRVALKARTLRARRQAREQPLEDIPQPPPPVSEPDVAGVIDRAVRRLPEMYRAAVVACDLEGLSRKDAAEQLGWKEGTLSGRLARARKLLADRLKKVGLALPAGGLAGVLGTDAPVRAGLAESVVELACGSAAGRVPASVAILTEGVVQGMFAFNLKAVAAVAVLVCGLGYGAWAVGGDDGPAPGNGLTFANGQPTAQPKGQPPAAPEKIAPALRPLQGKWRVLSITEGKKSISAAVLDLGEIEISGNTLWMPYRAGDGGKKREQYRIAVDDTTPLKEIDLIASGKPVARGIYHFTAHATSCAKCHTTEGLGVTPETARFMALCEPGVKAIDPHHGKLVGQLYPFAAQQFDEWLRTKHAQPAVGLRLAIATTGARPTKFDSGAEGVIEFRLERVAGTNAPKGAAADQLSGLRQEYERARQAVTEGRLAHHVALVELEAAKARLEQALQTLKVEEDRLKATFESYQAAVRKAEREGTAPAAPAKATAEFAVHVRPLAAAEKVIRVKATGNETVLEGLAYAAEDMALKADSVTVWIVRDKNVMPVDLAGITQRGETKTNYVLKPGDQLFVQVKVAK